MYRRRIYLAVAVPLLVGAGYLLGCALGGHAAGPGRSAALLLGAGAFLVGASFHAQERYPSRVELELLSSDYAALASPSPPRLGELLSQYGWVSEEDVRFALARQRQTGGRLGAMLVDMGLISVEELDRALVRQWLEYV